MEIVVDPAHRQAGLGDALWRVSTGATQGLGVPTAAARLRGARGDGAGASCTRWPGRSARRTLEAAATALPPGFTARAFRPGEDDTAWVETNAAAFSDHPEQGQMALADLRERMAQAVVRPEGFIVVEADDAPGRVAAFHWTKVEVDHSPGAEPARPHGEVYVVGVHPAYQGRGLARPLTALGSPTSPGGASRGGAVRRWRQHRSAEDLHRLGFRSIMVDVMYSGAVDPPVSG